jgi:tRNA threonylcarbamoyladenosine biosynthesis protein TsaE
MSQSIALPDVTATQRAGRRLGMAIQGEPNACVLIGLSGDLGAGKTTFVGGVLAASGVGEPIRSPTYTLIEPYELKDPARILYHLDLYRVRSGDELEALGVRELLSGNNVLLVEWVENAPALAALCDLTLQLTYAAPGRVLSLKWRTPGGERLANVLTGRGVTPEPS